MTYDAVRVAERLKASGINWLHFSTACQFVDPDISFEWGTKYLYLVPKGVTRDKWGAYTEEIGRAHV